MGWLKMDHYLAEKPETLAVALALNLDPDTVVGKFHRLWAWLDTQTTDFYDPTITADQLDLHCRCPGLLRAMAVVHWIAFDDPETGRGVRMVNPDAHMSESAKSRAQAQKRMQKKRSKDRREPAQAPPDEVDGMTIGGVKPPAGARRPTPEPPQSDAPTLNAIAAFDKWSSIPRPKGGRGHVLMPHNNEHAPVIRLIAELSEAPPIVRKGGDQVSQHLLIASAVDALMKDGVEFRNPAYAAGCVKHKLADWEATGEGTGRKTFKEQQEDDTERKIAEARAKRERKAGAA